MTIIPSLKIKLPTTKANIIGKNIYIKTITNKTLVTKNYSSSPIKIPIAHGEGRFYANETELTLLQDNDQILFKYCDKNGDISEESNPNGSLLNIAGICNKERNVFGMMPHPERASDTELKNTDGKILFESILGHIK